jgi:hypothetical protein
MFLTLRRIAPGNRSVRVKPEPLAVKELVGCLAGYYRRDWTFQNVTETFWVGHLEKVTLAL